MIHGAKIAKISNRSTMPEPVVITASIFSGFNSVIKAINLAAHYKEVPNEVKQLHTNIDRAESAINIARRLQRSKIHYADPRLIKDTDESIEKTTSILLLVRNSIEACRKDLEVKETVTAKNRVAWLLWKNQEFVSQLQTLGNCLDALDRDIVRMEMAHPPLVLVSRGRAPPAYAADDGKEDTDGELVARLDDEKAQKLPFPRSPTRRILRSNNSSRININKRVQSEQGSRYLSPQLQGDDEGYEFDRPTSRPQSRDQTVLENDDTREAVTDTGTLFANATIGVDTSGLGLSIPQGALNARQVRFLYQVASNTSSSVRVEPYGISELPASHSDETDQLAIAPTLVKGFSSRNPWRKLVAQPSTSTLTDMPGNHSEEAVTNSPYGDGGRLAATTTSTLVGDAEATVGNLLRLTATAPATPLASGSIDPLLSPETERRKFKWRRRSDFI